MYCGLFRFQTVHCGITAIMFKAVALMFVLWSAILTETSAAKHHRTRVAGAERQKPTKTTSTCYHAENPNHIRLWPGQAPGAVGEDPCLDIPFLQVFRSTAHGSAQKPALLIIPGGGYYKLTDTKEQTPVAEYFVRNFSVTAFVLFYRLVQPDGTYRYPVPMWDGQRAVKLIRNQAAQLGVDPARLGVFGFSAGGHLATTISLHPDTDFGLPDHDSVDGQQARPDLLGLGYPVISMDPASVRPSGSYKNLLRGFNGTELRRLQTFLSGEQNVYAGMPPVFIFESRDDKTISPENAIKFVAAVKGAGLPIDDHIFSHGVHGAGLAQNISVENVWPSLFRSWLQDLNFIQ